MGHYLISFVTYTFAMAGLLILALIIYKKATATMQKGTMNNFLAIEHKLDLSARKSICVVRAGYERFLIASDIDRTTLLAKLPDVKRPPRRDYEEQENRYEVPSERNYSQYNVKTFDLEEDKIPVLKSLVNKIDEQRK